MSAWRRRHAPALLVLTGLIELGIAALVVVAPGPGLAGVAVVAALYAVELRRLPAGAPCNCFGAVLDRTRESAVRRNVLLAGFGVVGSLAYLIGALESTAISEGAAGAALIACAAIAATDALARLPRPSHGAPVRPE